VSRGWMRNMGKRWADGALLPIRVGGRRVPVHLTISVLCWLVPGAWSGLGTLLQSLFAPAEIRDSGWFGSSTLAVVALYTVIVIGVPVLMLYRVRIVRTILTVVAALFTAAVITAPTLELFWVYVPVAAGAVLMWHPQSTQYLRKRIHHGNGAVL
jgi:hypothetical protein